METVLYRVIVTIYDDSNTEERLWGFTVLARSEHDARRRALEGAFRQQSYVSGFIIVEPCTTKEIQE